MNLKLVLLCISIQKLPLLIPQLAAPSHTLHTPLTPPLPQLAALSTPLALSVAVSHIFSKLPPHPLSITSLTASDVSQSDVCVLLHLLTQVQL